MHTQPPFYKRIFSNWRHYIRPHNLLATAFIFITIWLLSFIHLDHHFFDPFTYGIKDYDVTDIVYGRMRNTETKIDDRIVLVNTSGTNRDMLRRMLERIETAKPKVIGMDIFLDGTKDPTTDSLLAATLKQHDNIILANELKSYRKDIDEFEEVTSVHPQFSSVARTGFANFPGNDTRTIRFFSVQELANATPVRSFAAQLALQYQPELMDKVQELSSHAERIHYNCTSDNFLLFEPQHILDTSFNLSSVMRNKIVLLGYLDQNVSHEGPWVDRFFTPLNPKYTGRTVPDMYGVVIHANVIRMLLDGDYIRDAPFWLLLVLAIVICYINTFFFFWNYKYFFYFKPFPRILYRFGHLVQVLEILILFFFTAWFFYAYRIKIEPTIIVASIVLVFDGCIVYYYLRQHFKFLENIPEKFHKNHHHTVTNQEDPKLTNEPS